MKDNKIMSPFIFKLQGTVKECVTLQIIIKDNT